MLGAARAETPGRRKPWLLRYPGVTAASAALLVTGTLLLLGHPTLARLLGSLYALGTAAYQLWGMIRSWRERRLGVDLLAVIAIASAVTVGEYLAALIVVLMLAGGRALERMAEGRATSALRTLLDHAPRLAHRLRQGSESRTLEDVPADSVTPGQTLLVRPGELVPVDGVLLGSSAELDESALTGESLPVERGAGDVVLAGSVNGGTSLWLRASATAAGSQYSRIVALVDEASRSRARTVRLADRYAVPFTVTALAVAAISWWLSGEAVRFAEVLVVATPCPLLIGAPVAFIGGMGRAAASGIVVKNGNALEALAGARTVVFDKTGTLTAGRPTLAEIRSSVPLRAASDDDAAILQLAASAEQGSSHAVAASIIAEARARGIVLFPFGSATERGTAGVRATCGGRLVAVGKREFIAGETGHEVSEAILVAGQTAAYVAIDGEYAGALILADALRVDAVSTLGQLGRLGVARTLVLSGDAQNVVDSIAAQCGIREARGGCLPEDKVAAVRELPRRPVIMVGDGVNDAPVLAAADVGVAMGARGSTAASESADVVIMVDELSRLPEAIRIARRTRGIALTSIWLGMGLSLGLMGVAVTGALPAVAGALAQELVDLAAIGVAIRAAVPAGSGRKELEGASRRPGWFRTPR